jgi:hypothetical protein
MDGSRHEVTGSDGVPIGLLTAGEGPHSSSSSAASDRSSGGHRCGTCWTTTDG